MSYEIDYKDERFQDVEAEKKTAISDMEQTYDGMINNSDKFYQDQINASKDWEKRQTQLQNEQTDFAIQKIEQEKDQTKKDYLKEQSGAYVDWQKQSNEYGANAEQEATMGMSNTGFSESAQVSMYNTYQNRVAVARESYNRAIMDFNNSITEARLANNSALAEIAYQALQQRLELSLQGFQYKNTLVLDKASRKTELDQLYHERWQDVLDQMNTENALSEEIRQFNAQLAEEQRQFDKLHGGSSSGGGGGRSSGGGGSSGSSGGSKIQKGSGKNTGIYKDDDKTALPKATADSILQNGGPQSPAEVDRKVKAGVLKETKDKNGNTVFKPTSTGKPTITGSMLYSSRRF